MRDIFQMSFAEIISTTGGIGAGLLLVQITGILEQIPAILILIPGFFEMDSVCYGTTNRQGNLVSIGIHENENPGWPSQFYTPDIFGDVDTVYIYILPD